MLCETHPFPSSHESFVLVQHLTCSLSFYHLNIGPEYPVLRLQPLNPGHSLPSYCSLTFSSPIQIYSGIIACRTRIKARSQIVRRTSTPVASPGIGNANIWDMRCFRIFHRYFLCQLKHEVNIAWNRGMDDQSQVVPRILTLGAPLVIYCVDILVAT